MTRCALETCNCNYFRYLLHQPRNNIGGWINRGRGSFLIITCCALVQVGWTLPSLELRWIKERVIDPGGCSGRTLEGNGVNN